MPYDPMRDELPPSSVTNFIQMAGRANFNVRLVVSKMAPEVRFLERDMGGGQVLRAVIPPDLADADAMVVIPYLAGRLQIPPAVFKV
jgi:hypothetical protein